MFIVSPFIFSANAYKASVLLQNKTLTSLLSFESVLGSEMHRMSVNIYSKVPIYKPVAILKIVYMYHKHLNLNAEDKGASQVLDWLFTGACRRAMKSTPFETSVHVIIYSTRV